MRCEYEGGAVPQETPEEVIVAEPTHTPPAHPHPPTPTHAHTLLLGCDDVHSKNREHRSIHRHRHGHLIKRNPVKELLRTHEWEQDTPRCVSRSSAWAGEEWEHRARRGVCMRACVRVCVCVCARVRQRCVSHGPSCPRPCRWRHRPCRHRLLLEGCHCRTHDVLRGQRQR